MAADIFRNSLDKLFYRLFWASMLFSSLTLMAQFIEVNVSDAVVTIIIWFFCLSSFFIYKNGKKDLAFHVLLVPISLLFVFMIAYQGRNYNAIFLLYPTGIILSFIFIDKMKILIYYLVFFIVCQLVILYYLKIRISDHFYAEFFGEGINVIAYNIIAFLVCQFYLTNLKRYKSDLDVTALHVENQKNELAEKNEKMTTYIESNLQLENFASLASHELKTPLRNIQNYVKLLERSSSAKLEKNELEILEVVTQNTTKMNALINALQELGKVTKSEMAGEPIDLKMLLEEIKDERRELIVETNADVVYEGITQILIGEKVLIYQLLSNLIGNALKFTKPDALPKVIVTAEEQDGTIYIKVIDNGIGIEEVYRPKIFQLFQRLHADSEYHGSGIGLAICKKIVELHKGTIWVEANPEGGSVFAIRFPKNGIALHSDSTE